MLTKDIGIVNICMYICEYMGKLSLYMHVYSYIAHMFPYILREVGFAHI